MPRGRQEPVPLAQEEIFGATSITSVPADEEQPTLLATVPVEAAELTEYTSPLEVPRFISVSFPEGSEPDAQEAYLVSVGGLKSVLYSGFTTQRDMRNLPLRTADRAVIIADMPGALERAAGRALRSRPPESQAQREAAAAGAKIAYLGRKLRDGQDRLAQIGAERTNLRLLYNLLGTPEQARTSGSTLARFAVSAWNDTFISSLDVVAKRKAVSPEAKIRMAHGLYGVLTAEDPQTRVQNWRAYVITLGTYLARCESVVEHAGVKRTATEGRRLVREWNPQGNTDDIECPF